MNLLVLFIDAFPYAVSKKHFTLGEEVLPLKSILGFSEEIRATIFSGTFPKTHGRWGTFVFNPKSRTFSALAPLGFLDLIPISFVERGVKFIVSKTLCKYLAKKEGYDELMTMNLPYGELTRFDFVSKYSIERPNVLSKIPTIFDVLREEGMDFLYIRWHKEGRNALRLLEEMRKMRLVVLYLDQLDATAHTFGMNSKRYFEKVREIQKICKKAIEIVGRSWGEWTYIIFSDHGMKPIDLYLPPQAILKDLPFKYGRDYLALIGATSIRFWYLRKKCREEIRERVSAKPYGHFLTRKELRQNGLNFEDPKYFEDIYLLNPGNLIFPNHMAWLKHKAMHGYDPNDPSQLGILCLPGQNFEWKTNTRPTVVDLAPTMLDLLGLRIPKSYEGRSLLK